MFKKKKVYEVIHKRMNYTENAIAIIKDIGDNDCKTSKVKTIYGYNKLFKMGKEKVPSNRYSVYQKGKISSICSMDPFESAIIAMEDYTTFAHLVTLFYYEPSVFVETLNFECVAELREHVDANWDAYTIYVTQENSSTLKEVKEKEELKNLKATQEVIGISKQTLEYQIGSKVYHVRTMIRYFEH